ncbi:adenine specific DNA methylase Mod [Corynebacterium mustelae]|uniref:Adenine specific DNA methylase Mod n=1 Tax=Corynebacterium mustelae TaxID=571915 RepID=A0A0G3GZX8_9CORY|nr:site-specific DNA-methyltransferase [Corynebacterium mustelae]AKK06691.1 adenine specific DNA methylase Mod [Corynebacterium mustelae]
MNENFDDCYIDEDLDDINSIEAASPDFRTELAKQLAEIAPEAIADGKVDFEKLKELLGDDVSTTPERFGLFWPGKREAIRIAQTPTTATLKPDFENSVDWDTTENVFIEGDNLEVLKILQRHYYGKIKMIYIDPPYNTGKDFVYRDDYRDSVSHYLEWTKQVNAEGQKLSSNAQSEGRYHSNWLNMMYPRLKVARNLLQDDGVIIISIDDSEFANLRQICVELFGENNFAANIIWKKRNTPPNDRVIGAQHDYLVAIGKRNLSGFNLRPRTEEQIARYKNPDGHPKGPWVAGDLSANVKGGRYVESLNYPIINPNTGKEYYPPNNGNWRFSQTRMDELLSNGEIFFGQDGKGAPKLKRFLSSVKPGTTWTTLWDFAPLNTSGSLEIETLFGNPAVFESPKPVGLIVHLLQMASHSDSIILDFFAGSSTTAHAVMELNAKDGGKRSFIQIQLPEPTGVKSTARKEGFENVPNISRERIRRAASQIQRDYFEVLQRRKMPFDRGFRAFKLAKTNFAKWDIVSDIDERHFEQQLLELHDSANSAASIDDLLIELLLKQGFSLTEKIGDVEISGLPLKAIHESSGGGVALLAYLDQHRAPTIEQLREVIATKPTSFIILEDCFGGSDELKTNLAQMCKTNNVELWTA